MRKIRSLLLSFRGYCIKQTYPLYLSLVKVNRRKPSRIAINQIDDREKRIIISLTTFPDRISFVHKTLYSLMHQDLLPDAIILWLAESQFPDKKLPDSILELQKYGLSIAWVGEDIKSYKKLIPALKQYPNDIIVTADDDLYYPRNWLRNLYNSYESNPDVVHCQLITRIGYINNHFDSIKRTKRFVNTSSYNNKILSGSGTLFPPGCLSSEVFNSELFTKLAPTSDDLWYWAMALVRHTPIKWIKENMKRLYFVEGVQENTPCLWEKNDRGERLFETHLNSLIKYFQLEELLNDDNGNY